MEGEIEERHGEVPAGERARLIEEIVQEWIATLGADKAWVRDQVVEISGLASPHHKGASPVLAGECGGGVFGHQAADDWLARSGKSASHSDSRFFFASAKSAGLRHSGMKLDRCQLWTVVAGILALEATVA
jgi:hypothetical protein